MFFRTKPNQFIRQIRTSLKNTCLILPSVSSLLKKKTVDAVNAYGLELLEPRFAEKNVKLPAKFKRIYVSLGHEQALSQEEREVVFRQFSACFYEQLFLQMPSKYKEIKVIAYHAPNSALRDTVMSPRIKTPHIDSSIVIVEMHKLAPGESALDLYANYLMALFFNFEKNNDLLPEVYDFKNSITRKNRTFQLYVMMQAMYNHLFPESVPQTQGKLMDELYFSLRSQNLSELFVDIPEQKMDITVMDKHIFQELVLPSIAFMRRNLEDITRNSDEIIVQFSAPPLFTARQDSLARLHGELPQSIYQRLSGFIKSTYERFPYVYEKYIREAPESPEEPQSGMSNKI